MLILILALKGCGIFDTRDPEEPKNIRSTFIPPTTTEAVLTNLTYSIIEKNSNNYQKCISDVNYKYIPDSKSQLIYGSLFLSWNYNSEKTYLDNLIAQTQNASSNLFLSNKNIRYITSDSSIVDADYIIVFQHNDPSIPKTSTGNVRLTISADEQNNFYINLWEDFRKHDSDFTWSELKANFSN